ncbi:hypothetical protein [Microbacterium album]|uniref:Uncharacterized protein n=1 Tax=Microbacterium album TaxID=2053191 RepID=A0A917MP35_9MICO|nr:hypothetical protein [Microbacterium album]GGH44995.1 hypothetical protein GCM10010921_20080 [Microbacterium album]
MSGNSVEGEDQNTNQEEGEPIMTILAEQLGFIDRLRIMRAELGKPITSVTDSRIDELVDRNVVRLTEEQILAHLPEHGAYLGTLYFQVMVSEIKDLPFPTPAWADEVQVYADDWPNVSIWFRKTILNAAFTNVGFEQMISVTVEDDISPDGDDDMPAGTVSTCPPKFCVYGRDGAAELEASPLALSRLGESLREIADVLSAEVTRQAVTR